jgi:hypothetical protein
VQQRSHDDVLDVMHVERRTLRPPTLSEIFHLGRASHQRPQRQGVRTVPWRSAFNRRREWRRRPHEAVD